DRTHLRAILQENKLSASGLIDPATARKLGQITGVEALVTGTITPFGDSVRVVIKVLDTETARIVAASSTEVAKTKTMEELLARDLSGQSNQATVSEPAVQSVQTTVTAVPVFQNNLMRVTLGQLTVTPDNRRAELTLTLENIGREPLSVALDW